MIDLARSPDQIGAIIRRHRRKLKLSQSELGERAGLRVEPRRISVGHPAGVSDLAGNQLKRAFCQSGSRSARWHRGEGR